MVFQQIRAGNTAIFAFGLGVVFVFLVLAAQFESLTLPLAVILIVPMGLVASISGVILRGQDNNILTQLVPANTDRWPKVPGTAKTEGEEAGHHGAAACRRSSISCG